MHAIDDFLNKYLKKDCCLIQQFLQYNSHVHGLPDLTVGPWELEIESDEVVEFVDEAEIEPVEPA